MGKQYVFKVYLPGGSRKAFRTLQISGSDDLDRLAFAILEAFRFKDDDHPYEFFMDGRPYSENCFQLCPEDGGDPTTEISLEELDLKKGQNFLFHFDFGDNWWFMVHVQRIEEEKEYSPPVLLKKKGKIIQYPSWDWEDD